MIDIGDFGPDLGLVDQQGRPCALYSQHIAGVSNAMIFVQDTSADGLAAAVNLIRDGFKASPGRPIVITPLPAAQTLQIAEAAKIEFPIWSDPDGKMITAIAGGNPSKAFAAGVFDRNGRLLAAGIDDNLIALVNKASEMCAEQAALFEPGLVGTQAPVLLIPRILEPSECDHLIQFWKDGEKRQNEISSGQLGDDVPGSSVDVKRRADVLVPQDDNPTNNLIRTRVSRRVVPELSKAFNFDAKAYDIGRIGCYDSSDSGFFRPHRDILSSDAENPRKFALSLNLNEEYTGGRAAVPGIWRADLSAAERRRRHIFMCVAA
jgi:hypothetical protein